MKAAHAVSLIEAAYRTDSPTEQWLEGIAGAAATALDSTGGAMAFQYEVRDGEWVVPLAGAISGMSPAFAHDFMNQEDMPKEQARRMAKVFKSVRYGTLRAFLERLQIPSFEAILDRHGVQDMVGVNGLDPTGRGCMLAIVVPKAPHPSRAAYVWPRLAAHISAGNRLRMTLDALTPSDPDPVGRAEAVLSPSGKVEHATGPAEQRAARDALLNALVGIDKARSERDDARRSVDFWRGLVAGRWSLVEHFERDGKRYFLAHKNDPELADDRGLTEHERLVLGYAEIGQSNKLISYALGLSSSTVSTLLARARKKVGIQP